MTDNTAVAGEKPVILINHLYETDHVERLRQRFPQVNFIHLPQDPPWPEEIGSAQALLFAGLKKPQLSALLRAATGVNWIHTGSAGFDWVQVPEVEQRQITITRSADVMSIPMAEFAIAAMLAHAKNLFALHESQQRKAWEPPMHSELGGKNLLVVGAGAIGKRVAPLASAFRMKVRGIKRSPEPVAGFDEVHAPAELDELLPDTDYLLLTTPLTPETEGMIDRRRLELLPSHAYLINLGRGPLLVEEDFVAAMQDQVIAGATLDAYAVEPLPADSPLWTLPNVLVSPHASYRTPNIRARVFKEFGDNLERYLNRAALANTMRHPELGY